LIDLSDGRLLGFEILARWHHPEKGLIAPDVFISIIERLGLMPEFTLGMLRRACLDAKDWPADLRLSLNVSPHELTDLLFPIRLLAVLSETGFLPSRLEIEITENALVADLETAKAILESLQNVGIKIALDDFGTGYSSLYHLRELKLDKIKIDRSFIQSMKDNPESAKIVYGILGLAKSLALPTTAEGIEDSEILDRLSNAGCEIGQGYHFGKAMPAAEASMLIQNLGHVAERRVIA
jgi:EAL domain-containing protein (putative c-di-GMP-specific phosphodiesterase class I)